jgi:transcriptional regulator of aromatic amino acid metabolism
LDQINERVQVHVVSTTSVSLFRLVQAGEFLADLHYELKLVLIVFWRRAAPNVRLRTPENVENVYENAQEHV